MALVGKKTYLC